MWGKKRGFNGVLKYEGKTGGKCVMTNKTK